MSDEEGTLWARVEAAAERWPDAELLVSRQDDRATFAEYHSRAEVMAAGLYEMGVRPGDVVSWILPTWVDTVVLAAALSRVGAIQNPIIAIYRDREVGFCARQTGARWLFTPGEFGGYDFAAMGERVAADGEGLTAVVVEPGGFPSGDPATLPPVPAHDPGEVRWYFYTSGTTADPKGARHTDASVGSFAVGVGERLHIEPGDRYSLVFPFPHVGGVGLLLMALHHGCCHLMDEGVDPVETVRFLSEQGCTHAGTATPFYLMYLAAQEQQDEPLFPNLKVCPGGGSPIPPAMHFRVKEELGGAGAASGWGLTEAPTLTNCDLDDPDEKIATTEGRALPGVDLIAVADDETVCPPGTEGELRAKGPMVMKGYVDASLDAAVFDANGYFRTGDLGIIDDDGFVTITGRLKDVIIRNAENISAKEVEDLLYLHDDITDVAVFGIPDPRTGERVCAAVVSDAALDAAALRDYLTGAGLRVQATPERVEIIEALPRNPAGKVLKRELQERFG